MMETALVLALACSAPEVVDKGSAQPRWAVYTYDVTGLSGVGVLQVEYDRFLGYVY